MTGASRLWTPKSNSAMFALKELSGGTHEQH